MKLIGVGIDVVDVGRFRRRSYQSDADFYKKIFTAGEIKHCLSKADPAQHFAARFAAKEAVIKALGSSIFKVNQIEVVNDKYGRPNIKLQAPSSPPAPRLRRAGKLQILISLSHEKDYAMAMALAIRL